ASLCRCQATISPSGWIDGGNIVCPPFDRTSRIISLLSLIHCCVASGGGLQVYSQCEHGALARPKHSPVGGLTAGASNRPSWQSRSVSTSPDDGTPNLTPMLPGNSVRSSVTRLGQSLWIGCLLRGWSGIGAKPQSR